MKKLILLLIIIPCLSHANSIYYGLHTTHTVSGTFNERNNVLIAQLDNGFTVGSMANSYHKPSMLFGYVQPDKPIAFGIVFATGYEPENFFLDKYLDSTPLMPMPLISLNISLTDTVSLSTNIVSGVVINTGLKFSF